MEPQLAIVGPIFLVAVVVGAFYFPTLRHVFPYKLTATRFEVRLLHILPLFWIDYRHMIRVSAWPTDDRSFRRYMLTIRLGNRFGRALVIETRGFPRYATLTPNDPRAFAREIETRIRRAGDRPQ